MFWRDNDRVSHGKDETPTLRVPVLTGLLLLVGRGLLLWAAVPLALLAWIVGWPYWRSRGATLSQLLGWADLNLIAALQRGLFRPLVVNPLRWTPVREVPTTNHRLRVGDPA